MSSPLTINGVTYNYPALGDENWGPDAASWASAVTSGMLQKSGGTFILTNEVDLGALYGVKSLYVKSRASNPASVGIFRLGNAETISWRNNANSADKSLTVSSSDKLTYNSIELVDLSSSQTMTNKTLTSPVITSPSITGLSLAGLVALSVQDTTTTAYNLGLASNSSTPLTTNRTLTFDVVDANRTLKIGGNITTGAAVTTVGAVSTGGAFTTAAAFTTAGAFALTLTATNTTNATIPAGTVTLVDLASLQTLSSKTLTSPAINTPTIVGGTHSAITALGIRDTSAAFDVTVGATSATALTTGRAITFDVKNRDLAFHMAGDLTLGGSLITSGNFQTTLTMTGTTAVTLPVSGTLATTVGSMVECFGANGYGSTDTKIRRFTSGNTVTTGSDITAADSAANATTFTIGANGVYAITYSDNFTATAHWGISVNSNQLTTAIETITQGHRRMVGRNASASCALALSVTLRLASGDVVRAHTDGTAAGGDTDGTRFTITQVAKY